MTVLSAPPVSSAPVAAPRTGDADAGPTGLWAAIPRGARLDEAAFRPRHRVLTVLLVLHLPVLAGIGLLRGGEHAAHDAHAAQGLLLWGQLAIMAVAAVLGQVLRRQVARASAVSLGLMIGADVLVHVGGGLTDLHIWFYVVLVLVALYQMWTPFVLAVGFVAIHHASMSLLMPTSVFSTPEGQANPILFALLHAVFLLAEATFLAYGWKFTEAAERARLHEQRRAEEEREASARAELELAEERARIADEAARGLAAREQRTRERAERLAALVDAGRRLDENVATATEVLQGLRSAIAEISEAASGAATTAREADVQARGSATTVARLSETMAEIDQIATAISGIADQTNLLALNATIESARAGEAGKGFAVVAGEVKDLASETAQATERIRRVVDAVRGDVAAAGAAMTAVQQIIDGVVDAQGTIAAAVEEQNAATMQAQEAMSGATREAARVAADLERIVSDD
jgi:methyl-accepting chemotaxis protein